MTATERLRALLDERGVEHYDGTECTLWLKDGFGYRASADEGLSGFIHLHLWCTTPEQAIEATLGRGTCEIVYERLGSHRCAACGARFFLDDDSGEPNFYDESGRATFPHFCPNCGAKVVDDASVD